MVGRLSRSAILHVGTEKTGSKAIQSVLAKRRIEIARLGCWYPSSPGRHNHIGLAIFAAPENTHDILEVFQDESGHDSPFDESKFARSLADEIAAIPSNVRTVIFSNEHCQSRLITVEHVSKLRSLLAPHFETITVILYLRRQDEMACSQYSTLLRGGGLSLDILSDIHGVFQSKHNPGDPVLAGYFEFEQLLNRYALVFGEAFVKPRIYEKNSLKDNNVAVDFLDLCGLPSWLARGTEAVNRAIPADGQIFLTNLNTRLADPQYSWDRRLSKKIRDICGTIAETRLSGPPRLPTRDKARRFYAGFKDMNERIREKWFPDRPTLFSQDFTRYPEFLDKIETSQPEAALRTAFVIIEELIREREEFEDMVHASNSWRVTAPLRATSLALKSCKAAKLLCRARLYLDGFRRKGLRDR